MCWPFWQLNSKGHGSERAQMPSRCETCHLPPAEKIRTGIPRINTYLRHVGAAPRGRPQAKQPPAIPPRQWPGARIWDSTGVRNRVMNAGRGGFTDILD
ncbi:hypothetical protein [Kamptonema formosum]|uniref:hypothetical protein n=1 Tax=Kamptonema formosum TaxID=331992 RepID=UPI00034B8742|nr:hypothetical protein [Oscillatoria sp. PCC 10802]